MDAHELKAAGWTHITDLVGPPNAYAAEWQLSEISPVLWWSEKDAVWVEAVRRRYGAGIPLPILRAAMMACKVCPILDYHSDTTSEWTEFQRDAIDALHEMTTELEDDLPLPGKEEPMEELR